MFHTFYIEIIMPILSVMFNRLRKYFKVGPIYEYYRRYYVNDIHGNRKLFLSLLILYVIYRYYRRKRHDLLMSIDDLPTNSSLLDDIDSTTVVVHGGDNDDDVDADHKSSNHHDIMASSSSINNFQNDLAGMNRNTHDAHERRQSKLMNFLVQTAFVGSLEQDVYSKLVPLMNVISLKKGDCLFNDKTSEACLSLYIIRNGKLGVYTTEDTTKNNIISVFTRGQSMCEFGLLGGLSCTKVGVVALVDSEIFELKREIFDNFSRLYARETITFLDTTIASQWRVASFVLEHFVKIPLNSRVQSQGEASIANLNFSSCGIRDQDHEHHNGGCIPSTILECASTLTLRKNEELFVKGDPATSLFIVEHGVLNALDDNSNVISDIHAGSVAGGISFFGGTDRGETLIAAVDHTVVKQLNKVTFRRLTEQAPQDALKIARTVGKQLAPVLLEFFQLGLQTKWYHSGDVVFKQNDVADSLFVIISGRVRAYINNNNDNENNTKHRIFDFGRGETLGAATILLPSSDNTYTFDTTRRRKFTAVAVRDTRIVRLSRNCFLYILKHYPEVMIQFTQNMAKQMYTMNDRIFDDKKRRRHANISTIALIPIGSNRRSLGPFATRLSKALSKLNSTLHLSSERFEQLFRQGSSLKLDDMYYAERASHWIMEQEENHKYVVFEGDHGSDITPWNKCCVRHADCVLLVGRANANHRVNYQEDTLLWSDNPQKTLNPLWQQLRISSPTTTSSSSSSSSSPTQQQSSVYKDTHKILIILHSDPSPEYMPTNTQKWFKGRSVRSFHHIRMHHANDFDRLARHLAGESVAVVLSGGGARGLAHYGALQAIEEAGIPIDIIAGTSQGAFMAASYSATGGNAKNMRKSIKILTDLFSPWQILKGFMSNFPWVVSYFSGFEMSETLYKVFKKISIEDLWIPYFCVVTNMSQLEMEIYQQGTLWKLVRASMSVLPFLPPCTNAKNEVLIDGGYVNNLPVDVMCEMWQPGLVIGVDVEDKDTSLLQNVYNYGAYITSIEYLWNKYVRRRTMYQLSEVMMWLTCINHTRQLRHVKDQLQMIDVYIRPQVQQYGLLDYPKISELAALGYIEAKHVLGKWTRERAAASAGVTAYQSKTTALKRTISTQLARNLSSNTLERYNNHQTPAVLTRRHSDVHLHALS